MDFVKSEPKSSSSNADDSSSSDEAVDPDKYDPDYSGPLYVAVFEGQKLTEIDGVQYIHPRDVIQLTARGSRVGRVSFVHSTLLAQAIASFGDNATYTHVCNACDTVEVREKYPGVIEHFIKRHDLAPDSKRPLMVTVYQVLAPLNKFIMRKTQADEEDVFHIENVTWVATSTDPSETPLIPVIEESFGVPLLTTFIYRQLNMPGLKLWPISEPFVHHVCRRDPRPCYLGADDLEHDRSAEVFLHNVKGNLRALGRGELIQVMGAMARQQRVRYARHYFPGLIYTQDAPRSIVDELLKLHLRPSSHM